MANPVRLAMQASQTDKDGTPSVQHSIHVDDISQEAAGSELSVFAVLTEAGSTLTQALQEDGFEISSKSTLICNNRSLAGQLMKFFARRGITLGADKVGEHLGHARPSSRRHSFKYLNKRFAKAAKRTKRVAVITKLPSWCA